jgi:hypothetical protein
MLSFDFASALALELRIEYECLEFDRPDNHLEMVIVLIRSVSLL